MHNQSKFKIQEKGRLPDYCGYYIGKLSFHDPFSVENKLFTYKSGLEKGVSNLMLCIHVRNWGQGEECRNSLYTSENYHKILIKKAHFQTPTNPSTLNRDFIK